MSSGRNRGRGAWPGAVGLAFFLLGLGGGFLYAEQPTRQPAAYDHLIHTQKSDCVRCHRGARDGIRAGLPDMVTCAGCHATAPGKEPGTAEKQLWARVLKDQAPDWNRLHRMPAHTRFSHRQHVTAADIDCIECHGEMDRLVEPPPFPLVRIEMRKCIDCHQAKGVTVDCTSCHG
jgi:hypothetical protein